jgi:hypothetical protein
MRIITIFKTILSCHVISQAFKGVSQGFTRLLIRSAWSPLGYVWSHSLSRPSVADIRSNTDFAPILNKLIYSRNPQCFSRRLRRMQTIILVGLLLHFQPFVNFPVALTAIDTLTCHSSTNYDGRLTTPRNLRSFYIHGTMLQTTRIVYFFSPLQSVPCTQTAMFRTGEGGNKPRAPICPRD